MSSLLGFAGEVLTTGAISGILLTVAAYLGRAQIANFFNKDIERVKSDFLHQLESAKAKHQRELEEYRVTLIASTERLRAEQSVKTVVALKFSEQKFNAINAINVNYANLSRIALAIHALYTSGCADTGPGQDEISALKSKFDAKIDALTESIYGAELFMESEDVKLLHLYESLLSGIVQYSLLSWLQTRVPNFSTELNYLTKQFASLPPGEDRLRFVLEHEQAAATVIKKYANLFVSMDVDRGVVG